MLNKGFQKGHSINNGRKGFKHSEETKLKMSLSSRGNKNALGIKRTKSFKEKCRKRMKLFKHSNETKEKIKLIHLGKKHSEETKLKMSLKRRGENNPRYIKDRSKLKTPEDRRCASNKYWIEECKKRDNKKCMMRNKECNGQLEVHHILSWRDHPELRYDINNGITLCHFHHPRGRVMEEKMVEYLKELINKKIC